MLNQLRFICSFKHFCRKGIREMDQMYEKGTFYDISNFGGDLQ